MEGLAGGVLGAVLVIGGIVGFIMLASLIMWMFPYDHN